METSFIVKPGREANLLDRSSIYLSGGGRFSRVATGRVIVVTGISERYKVHFTANQTINYQSDQSIKQSIINQTNQSTRPMNQTINYQSDQSIKQSIINQANQSIRPVNQNINYQSDQSIKHQLSIKQINQPDQ